MVVTKEGNNIYYFFPYVPASNSHNVLIQLHVIYVYTMSAKSFSKKEQIDLF